LSADDPLPVQLAGPGPDVEPQHSGGDLRGDFHRHPALGFARDHVVNR
jgi:hypothetical protein